MIDYINTDLVITGEDLQPLDQAFKDAGLHALGEITSGSGVFNMGYETDHQHAEPEPNIEVFLNVIEALDGVALKTWNACKHREFDIGYQSDTEPRSFNQALSPEVLKRIASVNAALRITLYATELPKRR